MAKLLGGCHLEAEIAEGVAAMAISLALKWWEVVGSGGKWQRSRYVEILKEKGRVVRRRLQG